MICISVNFQHLRFIQASFDAFRVSYWINLVWIVVSSKFVNGVVIRLKYNYLDSISVNFLHLSLIPAPFDASRVSYWINLVWIVASWKFVNVSLIDLNITICIVFLWIYCLFVLFQLYLMPFVYLIEAISLGSLHHENS